MPSTSSLHLLASTSPVGPRHRNDDGATFILSFSLPPHSPASVEFSALLLGLLISFLPPEWATAWPSPSSAPDAGEPRPRPAVSLFAFQAFSDSRRVSAYDRSRDVATHDWRPGAAIFPSHAITGGRRRLIFAHADYCGRRPAGASAPLLDIESIFCRHFFAIARASAPTPLMLATMPSPRADAAGEAISLLDFSPPRLAYLFIAHMPR